MRIAVGARKKIMARRSQLKRELEREKNKEINRKVHEDRSQTLSILVTALKPKAQNL